MASNSIRDLWSQWNLRSFVKLSLLLQIFLILFAPLRKKTANSFLHLLLWLSYLMADWVAAFGIGLISHNQGNLSTHVSDVDGTLKAFWASFLLLHLGGPDTITAFSLEDSSLWRRHLLNFVFQVCAAIYVCVQIFSSDKSLKVPTILVLVAGVIKNAERTRALSLSSLPTIKESLLPWDGGYLFEWYVQGLENRGNGHFDEKEANLAVSTVVKHAYFFFLIFRVFLGDFIFPNKARKVSHEYFQKVSAVDALRVISIELQFIYEMLHTKVLAIRNLCSYIFRFIAFTNIVIAFVLFNHLKKHRLSKLDVVITYSLLFGGIVVDVIALFMLVFSDQTVSRIMWLEVQSSKLNSILHKLVSAMDHMRKPRFIPCETERNDGVDYKAFDTPSIFQRWSESISACNLLSIALSQSPREIYKRERCGGNIAFSKIFSFPLKVISQIGKLSATIYFHCGPVRIANTRLMSKNPFIKELWIFIFEEVKHKSKNLDDLMEVKKTVEARGDLFLKNRPRGIDCDNLLEYVTKFNYDDSIIIWHIATELWYNIDKLKGIARNKETEFGKILSDYMLYLFLNKSNVVSAVAGVAQLTSMAVSRDLYLLGPWIDLEGLCATMFLDDSRSESLYPLRQGVELAREMEGLGERKWEVMSGVWVEMLSYAAIHVKGEAHVQVLSKGGELLAFVWLLMAHVGCFYKPEWGLYDRDVGFTRPQV